MCTPVQEHHEDVQLSPAAKELLEMKKYSPCSQTSSSIHTTTSYASERGTPRPKPQRKKFKEMDELEAETRRKIRCAAQSSACFRGATSLSLVDEIERDRVSLF